MAHKAKMKKKNKVAPCADANTREKERIAMQNHKKEVIRKKIEKMMQERKKQMEEQEKAKLDSSSPTLNPSFTPNPICGDTEENKNITE